MFDQNVVFRLRKGAKSLDKCADSIFELLFNVFKLTNMSQNLNHAKVHILYPK